MALPCQSFSPSLNAHCEKLLDLNSSCYICYMLYYYTYVNSCYMQLRILLKQNTALLSNVSDISSFFDNLIV